MKKISAVQSGKFRNHLSRSLNRMQTYYYLCHKRFELDCLITWDKHKHLKRITPLTPGY